MQVLQLTVEEFAAMAKIVYDRTGIHLPEEKRSLLSNRLRKRLRALELDSFDGYRALISDAKRCDEELPHFLSAVTTNETYFFRNEKLWSMFVTDLIPYFNETKKSTAGKSLRIWSAACSTGAEAYTTAIVLREKLPEFSSWNVTVIASDISENVLNSAREALYDQYALSRTDESRIKRWFHREGDKYRLVDEIREMVRFEFRNLRDPYPNARFDLIFLRNVLMYFDTPMKKRVLSVVSDALVPGGRLIVGDVDPIRTVPELNECLPLDYVRPGLYAKPAKTCAGATPTRAATA